MWVRDSHPGLQRIARVKRTGVVILLVLATLLWTVGIVAVWAQRQMLDTQNWVQTSDRLLENQQIREALSTAILQRVYASAPVENKLRETLPAQPAAARRPDRRGPARGRQPQRPEGARQRRRAGRVGEGQPHRPPRASEGPQRRRRARRHRDAQPPRPHRAGRRRHRPARRGRRSAAGEPAAAAGAQDRQDRGRAEGAQDREDARHRARRRRRAADGRRDRAVDRPPAHRRRRAAAA